MLNRRDFKEWLDRFDPEMHPCKKDRCPLAAYLDSLDPEVFYIVGHNYVRGYRQQTKISDTVSPYWAQRFIFAVDRAAGFGKPAEQIDPGKDGWQNLTAAQLQEILNDCPK